MCLSYEELVISGSPLVDGLRTSSSPLTAEGSSGFVKGVLVAFAFPAKWSAS